MSDQKMPGRVWYREPMMWLVLGGPFVVVVASLVTYALAAHHADPVIERDAIAEAQRVGKALTSEQRESLEPALRARNHVASPLKDEAR